YARAHGLPATIDALAGHECINFRTAAGRIFEWEFMAADGPRRFTPQGRLTYNDPQLVLQAVLDGQGLAQMPDYLACEPLRSAALVACLARYAAADRGHYLCYQSRRHMPTRMRAFIDFMMAGIRDLDLDCATGLEPA